MLFVLTGNIQTGKTRWLELATNDMKANGIAIYGVLAPGIWVDHRDEVIRPEACDDNGFEKTGIDNILLPSGERIAFARRADLALRENDYNERAQSARAKLGWHISDEAIARVNEHFAQIATAASNAKASHLKGLLVVDELGRLELERGEGLTEALAVLEAGPTPLYQHALIVVREMLLPHLEGKFAAWGPRELIGSNANEHALISSLY